MSKIRRVLQLLHEAGLSQREAARVTGISKSSVGEIASYARAAGLTWPQSKALDDEALRARVYPPAVPRSARHLEPDWPQVHQQLKLPGVTLQLLWEEYRQSQGEQAYKYSTLNLAVEKELIGQNPMATMTPTKAKHTKKVVLDAKGNPAFDEPFPDSLDPAYIKAAKNADPLNAEERKSVLSRMSGQIRNIFLFAMWTGLRTGELISLRWCDVSEDGRRVVVRLALSKSSFTTKGRRARWVDLTEPAIAALNAQRQLTGSAGKWVFHNPRIGDRWQNSQRLRVQWIRALKAAGVRYRKPYQTRHTYASMMVSAGESPEWVAEQMGHLDGRLVAQVYGRWLRPPKVQPGRAAAEVYAQEWEEANSLVSLEDANLSEEEASLDDREVALAGDSEVDEEDI